MSREVMAMRMMGYLSALDGFRLLQAGLPIYIVSAPIESQALPLEGTWRDEEGKVHLDCSCICLSLEKAYEIGKAYNQQCILRLYPCYDGKAEVYLLKDTAFARQVSLDLAGGYTADGDWLLVAIAGDCSPFSEAYEDMLPADMDFLPVK
jgi:hypothetical protein